MIKQVQRTNFDNEERLKQSTKNVLDEISASRGLKLDSLADLYLNLEEIVSAKKENSDLKQQLIILADEAKLLKS